VTTWLRVLSKLLTIATDWPASGASEPAAATVMTTSRESDPPVASGPQLPAVTPLPDRRGSVMLPPLTLVWIAPRKTGPVLPVLAMWYEYVVLPTWTLPIVSVGVAVLPFSTPAPVMPWFASPAVSRSRRAVFST